MGHTMRKWPNGAGSLLPLRSPAVLNKTPPTFSWRTERRVLEVVGQMKILQNVQRRGGWPRPERFVRAG